LKKVRRPRESFITEIK